MAETTPTSKRSYAQDHENELIRAPKRRHTTTIFETIVRDDLPAIVHSTRAESVVKVARAIRSHIQAPYPTEELLARVQELNALLGEQRNLRYEDVDTDARVCRLESMLRAARDKMLALYELSHSLNLIAAIDVDGDLWGELAAAGYILPRE